MDRKEKEINTIALKPNDLKEIKMLRSNPTFDEDDGEIGQDTLLVRLKESQANSNLMADDICNILRNDLFERKKQTESFIFD